MILSLSTPPHSSLSTGAHQSLAQGIGQVRCLYGARLVGGNGPISDYAQAILGPHGEPEKRASGEGEVRIGDADLSTLPATRQGPGRHRHKAQHGSLLSVCGAA